MRPRPMQCILLLSAVLIAVTLIGITTGSVKIPLAGILSEDNRQIIIIRIARVALALIAGGALAVAGTALQAILRNPLAEPYLLGTSSGAGLGAVLALMLGLGGSYLPGAAFIGAIVSVVLVYSIARQNNRISAQSLILSGVIVSIALSGMMVFIISISGTDALHSATWWLWGSLEVTDMRLLRTISIIVMASVSAIIALSQDMNAISIGEQHAVHLGIKIESVKKALFVLTSLITACLVCICGMIGFVGLIIPHAIRSIVGPNHRYLLPASFIAGSSFMVACDAIARTAFSPSEIPIGVMTSIIGAPVFIILLKRNQRVR